MDKTILDHIGQAAYDKRGGRRGVNLRTAAEQSGIPFPTLSRVERGLPMSLDTFRAVCAWTGRDANELLMIEKEVEDGE